MTNQEAFYVIGNIPIPTDDTNYDICQYQEAKAIALDCIQKVDDLAEHDAQIRAEVIDEFRTMAIGWNKISSKRIPIVAIDKITEQLKEQNND